MQDLRRLRSFWWFLGAQFLGAFNDNLYKNALLVMIAFEAANEAESGLLVSMAAGLFILPYTVFSMFAGQLADKYPKASVIRWAKYAEVAIMVLALLGFVLHVKYFLMLVLFLMGTQSAFFGPAKYSVIPEIVPKSKLMYGTAMTEMGTFFAIVLGTMLGAVLVSYSPLVVGLAVVAVACVGAAVSRRVISKPAADPEASLSWNPWRQLVTLYHASKKEHSIWCSLMAMSWFWFLGATYLSQVPTYVKFALNADETMVSVLLTIFTASLGLGSWASSVLSRGRIELALVSVGAIGTTLSSLDIGLFSQFSAQPIEHTSVFIATYWRVLFDLFAMGFFGSLYIVPLHALIQKRSADTERSRANAANNVYNAIFMVLSAVMVMGLYKVGLTTSQVFLVVAGLNLGVLLLVWLRMPESYQRWRGWQTSLRNRIEWLSKPDFLPDHFHVLLKSGRHQDARRILAHELERPVALAGAKMPGAKNYRQMITLHSGLEELPSDRLRSGEAWYVLEVDRGHRVVRLKLSRCHVGMELPLAGSDEGGLARGLPLAH